MQKLFNIMGIFSIATLLSFGGLLAYSYQAGHLNSARLSVITETLRGEHDDLLPVEEGGEAVTDGDDGGEAVPTGKKSADLLRDLFGTRQLVDARIDSAIRALEAKQELLETTRLALVQAEEKFAKEKTRWSDQREKLMSADADEAFQKKIDLVEKMEATLAKDYVLEIYRDSPADAVRIIAGLPERTSGEILNTFRSAEEVKIMRELLDGLAVTKY